MTSLSGVSVAKLVLPSRHLSLSLYVQKLD
jgi:hypothetical protein